jgi:hypothetical protein
MRPVGIIHLHVRWVSLGLAQVQAADHKNSHNSSDTSRDCVSRGRGRLYSTPKPFYEADVLGDGDCRFLSRTLDPARHYFVRSCVIIPLRLHHHAQTVFSGAASFTIYTETKDNFRAHNYLNRNRVLDAALVGGVGGVRVYYPPSTSFPHFLG